MDENSRQLQYNLGTCNYVIGISNKSLRVHSNKNTGKVTAPVHRKKCTGEEFKFTGTRIISHLYITISQLVIFFTNHLQ